MLERRIPVGIVLTSLDPGGTERQMTELVARLDPTRFEVHVACFRRKGHWLERVERAATSVAEFRLRGFRSPATLGTALRFARWCRDRELAVLQACDFYANVFGLPAAALASVPVRIGSRRDLLLPGRTNAQHRLQRHAYRWAHCVIANSRAAAAQVIAEGVSEPSVKVIPNGIDLARYVRSARSSNAITTVANLRLEKGHDVLLAAAALVLRHHPEVRFRLVGDGPQRPVLEHQARELGIADRVDFLRHREDVPALLAASSLFVLPSRTEAFPNGILEAMAAALPVIASDVGGIPELVQHRRNGLLVPPGDAVALADAITQLRTHPSEAERLATAARAAVEARYSFDRMVREFEQLYLSALAGSRFPIRALCAW